MPDPRLTDSDIEGARVLVVEDQPEIRLLLSRLLKQLACTVVEAGDGATATDLLRDGEFDLILLDLTLPDMNGMLLFELVRASPLLRYTPVVFLTGESAVPVKARAYEQGAADYITKPFSLVELQARLKSHLRTKRDHDRERATAAVTASRADLARQSAERRFTALVENSFDLICELNPSLLIEYASPNHFEVLGLVDRQLHGLPWLARIHAEERLAVAETLNAMLDGPHPARFTSRFQDALGAWRYLDVSGSLIEAAEPSAPRLLVVSRDVTPSKTAELRLIRMAMEDPLTEISNRQHFSLELERILSSPRDSRGESLMFADIDDFKVINDTRGHPAGDAALKAVATELRRICRTHDLVARVGGDEFCLLMRDIHPDTAIRRAEQIVTAFQNRPLRHETMEFRISVSLGVANIEPGMTAEEAIARADTALYAAKAAGKGRSRVYTPDSEDLSSLRSAASWCERLKAALGTDRFVLHYQPIVALATGEVVRHEALLRYRDDDGTLIPPGLFLPAARRFKLMPAIDRTVLTRVLADCARHPDLMVSINISGSHLVEPAFVKLVRTTTRTAGIAPARLTLEITETEYMEDLVRARESTELLRDEGFRFALDDFGTGFSSLRYLRQLPVDYVKIDGSFVENVIQDKVDLALLRSINEIAHLLGKQTVAEFVSSQPLAELLAREGIDLGQGFALGHPAPLEQAPNPSQSSPSLPKG